MPPCWYGPCSSWSPGAHGDPPTPTPPFIATPIGALGSTWTCDVMLFTSANPEVLTFAFIVVVVLRLVGLGLANISVWFFRMHVERLGREYCPPTMSSALFR
jgi:hypothetical protein